MSTRASKTTQQVRWKKFPPIEYDNISPEHAVDVGVMKEENGVERCCLVLPHVAMAPHPLATDSEVKLVVRLLQRCVPLARAANEIYHVRHCDTVGPEKDRVMTRSFILLLSYSRFVTRPSVRFR